jgi:peptidoglycan/xylan/chitin deacetylase (PgdA/CDA1 family)
MDKKKIYYHLKPLIPRWVQIELRRRLVQRRRPLVSDIWPIDQKASEHPAGWSGWPEHKQFSLILIHDVDTVKGHDKCRQLMEIERRLGFRSSFHFVPERYSVSSDLRKDIKKNGFDIGVHGLRHDGRLFSSKRIFQIRAPLINNYLKEWNAVGFSSPSMHHNLDWMTLLNIEYAMTTFDTDPFEPQSDGMLTIYPFAVNNNLPQKGHIELPYTLPQDFTLFILMREKNIEIWKRKLDWIAEKGGMALLNSHPDYMSFDGGKLSFENYPVEYYEEFLNYVKSKYEDQYWQALPRDMARFWMDTATGEKSHLPKRVKLDQIDISKDG